MSVSTSVRMALAKGNKRQVELAELLGFTRQAVNLKLAKERWTGAELARVADFTGGKLAFVYPDGQQILVDLPDGIAKAARPARQPAADKELKQKTAEKPARQKTPEKPQAPRAAAGKTEKKTPAPGKKTNKPAASGKEKLPLMKEEQLSFFG